MLIKAFDEQTYDIISLEIKKIKSSRIHRIRNFYPNYNYYLVGKTTDNEEKLLASFKTSAEAFIEKNIIEKTIMPYEYDLTKPKACSECQWHKACPCGYSYKNAACLTISKRKYY